MKMRVEGQGVPEMAPRLFEPSPALRDHPGVEEQSRVTRPGPQGFGDRRGCVVVLPVLVEGPGQDVPGVDVPARLELAPGQRERTVQLDVVISVEVRELPVVDDLVQLAEPADVLDQVVLAACVVLSSERAIDVSEG